MTAPAATSAAADAFARTVSTTAALELQRMLHALGAGDPTDPATDAWFIASQRAVLRARITLLAVRDLAAAPPAVAVTVLPRLLEIADAAVAHIPAAVLAADDGDAKRAYIAAVEPVYDAVLGPATDALTDAGLAAG